MHTKKNKFLASFLLITGMLPSIIIGFFLWLIVYFGINCLLPISTYLISIFKGFILVSFTNVFIDRGIEKNITFIMAKIIILVIVIPFLLEVLLVGIATYLYYNLRPKLAINPKKEETKFNFANIKLMFLCYFLFIIFLTFLFLGINKYSYFLIINSITVILILIIAIVMWVSILEKFDYYIQTKTPKKYEWIIINSLFIIFITIYFTIFNIVLFTIRIFTDFKF